MDFYTGSAVVRSEGAAGKSIRDCYAPDRCTVRRIDDNDLVARRSARGLPLFNFPQTVWLSPRVTMDWGPHFTPAVNVLAVNLLTLAFHERDAYALFGTTCRQAIKYARTFAADVLQVMPREGCTIPREFLVDWSEYHCR